MTPSLLLLLAPLLLGADLPSPVEGPPDPPAAAPAGCEPLEARIRELEAKLAKMETVRSLKAHEGYLTTRWGMSKKQVKALFPKARAEGETLATTTEVAGKSAIVVFVFAGDRLARVGVVFTERYLNTNQYVLDFEAMCALVTRKYGAPTEDEERWSGELFRDDPEQLGTAVASGQHRRWTTWETPETEIEASLSGERFEVTHKIIYSSRALAEVLAAESERAKLDGL